MLKVSKRLRQFALERSGELTASGGGRGDVALPADENDA